MREIVECIPNFSEGRRPEVVDAIVAAIRGAGVAILEVRSDAEQNRSVIRFAGSPTAVERAALASAAVAIEQIDMRVHEGLHPRLGALDVLPFVPVRGLGLEACVELAQRVAGRLARELDLPVYLYGAAARRPDRVEIGSLREGQYEGLAEAIASDPDRAPDFGPKRLASAGATVVGARQPRLHAVLRLVHANADEAAAIAAALDQSSGGLDGVDARAIEAEGEPPGIALGLRQIDRTPLHRVLALARAEAGARDIRIQSCELVGAVPQRVLDEAGVNLLQLGGRPEQVIERMVWEQCEAGEAPSEDGLAGFLETLAADRATPGGGSVAALAGALGAALAGMVAGLTAGRPKFAAVEAEMQAASGRARKLRQQLHGLMAADAEAFDLVMMAYRQPRGTNEEASARREAIQAALREATRIPLEVMKGSLEVLELARLVAAEGNASAVSDAGVAGHMAHAAVRAAALNVEINVMGIRDLEEGDRLRAMALTLHRRADGIAELLDREVRARIAGSP